MKGGDVGIQNAPNRSKAHRVAPRRLAHVLLFVTDISRAIKFYRDVLGLRLSDRSGDLVAFMHGVHGSDHHMIAFVKSDGPGLHHLSWDVGSINDIGVGASHMAEKGFAYGWGLGRHVLGSNYFHYVRDPWGSYAEYSCDIDYIPVTQDWKDGDHPPEELLLHVGSEPAGRLRAQLRSREIAASASGPIVLWSGPRGRGSGASWKTCLRSATCAI